MNQPTGPDRRGGTSAGGGAVRAGILEHAARLFAEKGFEGTSLMDIARAERFRMLDRSEAALPEAIADRHLRAKRTALTGMTTIIADGIRTAEFRETDERLAALSVIGMCNWVAWWYRAGRDADPELVAYMIAESAVAMLARPPHR